LTSQWTHDALGNVLSEISPRQCASGAPCFQGQNGQPITDGLNLITTYAYDGLLRLSAVHEDANHQNLVTQYAYDPAGHLLTQTDANTFITTYTIDNLGRTYKV